MHCKLKMNSFAPLSIPSSICRLHDTFKYDKTTQKPSVIDKCTYIKICNLCRQLDQRVKTNLSDKLSDTDTDQMLCIQCIFATTICIYIITMIHTAAAQAVLQKYMNSIAQTFPKSN